MMERNRRLRQERRRQHEIHDRYSPIWFWTEVARAARAGQGWFIIGLAGMRASFCDFALVSDFRWDAGMFIGVNAAVISIVTAWLSDIKMGYCRDAWWLNRHFCCWEVDSEDGGCSSWRSWGYYTPEKWLIYVLCAVCFSPFVP